MPGTKTRFVFFILWVICWFKVVLLINSSWTKILLESNTVILKNQNCQKGRVDRDQVRHYWCPSQIPVFKKLFTTDISHPIPSLKIRKFDRLFLNKLSEKPVCGIPWIWKQQGRVDLIKHLTSRGYYQSKVGISCKIKGKQANVTYDVDPGPPLMKGPFLTNLTTWIFKCSWLCWALLGLQPGPSFGRTNFISRSVSHYTKLFCPTMDITRWANQMTILFWFNRTENWFVLQFNSTGWCQWFQKFTIREVNVFYRQAYQLEGLKDTIIQKYSLSLYAKTFHHQTKMVYPVLAI